MYSLQIDESSFHCLTCNLVLALDAISTHFDHTDHKQLYSEGHQAYIDLNVSSQKEKPPVEVNKEVEKPKAPVATVNDQKPNSQNEAKKEVIVEVSEIKPTAPIEQVKKPIPEEKKPEKSIKNLEKGSPDFDDEICKALQAKDYIAVDENGRKWCLLCDWTMENASIDLHIYGKHHQTILKMHKERMYKKKIIDSGSVKPVDVKKQEKTKDCRSLILDMLEKLDNNDIMVDSICNEAFCKKCSIALDFDHLLIEKHIIEHNKDDQNEEAKKTTNSLKKVEDARKVQKIVDDTKKPQSPTTKKAPSMVGNVKKQERETESRASSAASSRESDDDVEKLAKANNLVFNRNCTKIYCPVCDTRIPSTIRNINQHVSGTPHKNNTTMKSMKPNYKQIGKKAMKDFVTDVVSVENGYARDVIVNNKYTLNYYSFIMITKQHNMRCEACEIDLNSDQVEQHKISPNHQKAMRKTMVLVSLTSEFIREVSLLFCV